MSSSSDAGYTVLVVDDNEDLLASVSFALQTLGSFRVVVAHDGVEGLEKAIECRPDCMVIDVKMPDVGGLQVVRALRGDRETARIPLVILSGLAQPEDQLRGMYAGADQYLIKPMKPQGLVEAIHRAIALTEEERQRRMGALADGEEA
jgi:CheY-like chemotaxis protein